MRSARAMSGVNSCIGFRMKSGIRNLLLVLLFLSICNIDTGAQGNLLVTPRRVVFDGAKRSITLNLANVGDDTATYAISLVNIRMTEEGGFETIATPDPGQQFADKNLRFFPRTVTLPPREAQGVKVQVLRTSQLDPGEYRSHFYFRSVPNIKPLGEEEEVQDTTTISVRLTPVFGITIPAIIRVGESDTEVSLSDLELIPGTDAGPMLRLKFNRTGNFSVYGDLSVDHVSTNGTVTHVGAANGIAVYTPNASRNFQFKLSEVPGVDFGSGRLSVTFSSSNDTKPEVLATAELDL